MFKSIASYTGRDTAKNAAASKTYRSRIARSGFALAIVSVILIMVALALKVYWDYQRELNNGLRDQEAITKLLAENVARSLDSVEILLDGTAQNLSATDAWWKWPNPAEGYKQLNQRLRIDLPQLRALLIFDAQGGQRHSSWTEKPLSISVTDRPYWKAHIAGAKRYRFGPYVGRNTNRLTFAMTRSLFMPDGRFGGLLMANVENSYFETLCESIRPSAGFDAALVNIKGEILGQCKEASPPAKITLRSFAGVIAKGEFADFNLSGFKSSQTIEGKNHLFAAHTVPGYDELRVVAAIPISEAMATMNTSLRHMLALGTLAAILLLMALLLIRRQFVDLRKLTDELRQSHDPLESRVTEATQELEIANSKLQASNAELHDDIIKRQRLEAELLLSKEAAEAANRAKSEFLSHMSHEIRTPMNAIVGAARLLECEDLTSQQLNYTGIMKHSGRMLLSLIDNILDLSKIEAKCIDLKTETFCLAEIIDNLADLTDILAQDKNVKIIFDLQPGLPPLMLGDACRLEQVLQNLLSNAIKFTPKGEINLNVQKISADTESCRLLFVVSDTGIGIPPEKLEIIFDAFVQAENALSRTNDGAGLGLAICRRLVELMGGSIEVESVPGQGSRFAFTVTFQLPSNVEASTPQIWLPSCRKIKDSVSQTESLPPTNSWVTNSLLAGRRVLMVEDNQYNRIILDEMLLRFGIEVDAAVDGHEGIKLFQASHPYDAILMDLHLPGLDGFACARLIRALPEGRLVPIIALTANALSATKEECNAAGMNDHVAKPVDPESLLRTLTYWILGEQSVATDNNVNPKECGLADFRPDELPGIDLAKASVWSNGNIKILEQMLHRMLSNYGDTSLNIKKHLATGDVESAIQIGHDLMGLASTVGAITLSVAARQLNQEIHAGHLDSTLVREAIDDIGSSIAQLKSALEILRDKGKLSSHVREC